MPIAYSLTLKLRQELKKPLGTLIRGSFVETMKRLIDLVNDEKPVRIIAVGDTVSKNLVNNHLMPQLAIIDNKSMRRKTEAAEFNMEKTIRVKNPKATITEEAVLMIREALKDDVGIKMIVDGEEDLLTLIAVQYAPENSFVVYGQPYEGIVVIKATTEKKKEIAEILKDMRKARKAK